MQDFKDLLAILNSSGVAGLFVILGFLMWKGGILSLWRQDIEIRKEFLNLANKFVAKTDLLADCVDSCKQTRDIFEKLEANKNAYSDHNRISGT
jgi:hypothetical protein